MMKEIKYNRFELIAVHFIKELKAIFSDSGALLILVGAMFIYPVIYSVGYFNETLTNLPIGIVDLDHSAASRKYAQMIDASSELNVSCKPESLLAAEQLFMVNKINGVVLIPKGFEKEIMAGRTANISVYADASYFLKYKNEILSVTYANAYFSGGISVLRYMAEGKSAQQAKVNNDPIPAQTHILYNQASSYGSFIMPGLILIIIQQTLLIGIGVLGGSFSESKSSPFLLLAKNRRKEIIPLLMGKTGAYLFISLFNIAFALIIVYRWFHYPDKANLFEVMMLMLPYLLSVIFLGIGLSTLFKHRESAIVFMVFLSPVALFLSGLSWPDSAMPEWIVSLSKIMPSTTAIPAYLRLRTMGVGISAVKTEIVYLYIQAIIYAFITISIFVLRILNDKKLKMKQIISA